jgi:hypothetical protein
VTKPGAMAHLGYSNDGSDSDDDSGGGEDFRGGAAERKPVAQGVSLELSPSARASCKLSSCKIAIAKGVPRLAEGVLTRVNGADLVIKACYHVRCGLLFKFKAKNLFGATAAEVDDACGGVKGFDSLSVSASNM